MNRPFQTFVLIAAMSGLGSVAMAQSDPPAPGDPPQPDRPRRPAPPTEQRLRDRPQIPQPPDDRPQQDGGRMAPDQRRREGDFQPQGQGPRGPRFGIPGRRGALLDKARLQREGKLRRQDKFRLHEGPRAEGLSQKLQRADPKKLFARLDQNSDGSISKEEFARAFGKAKAQKGEPRAKEKGVKKEKGEKADKGKKKEQGEKKKKEKD